MKTSRKKLIAKLKTLEKKLYLEHKNVVTYKKHLAGIVRDYRVILVAILLPSFIWGWQKGLNKGASIFFRQIVQFLLLTSLNHFKRKFR